MSYNKQNFIKGQILKADHLNAMETGIEANDQAIAELTEEIGELKESGSTGAWGAENAHCIIATDGSGKQVAAKVDEAFEVLTVEQSGLSPAINLFDESTMIQATSWYVNAAGKVKWQQNQYTNNYVAVSIPLYGASEVTMVSHNRVGGASPRIYCWFIADEGNNILSESAAGIDMYFDNTPFTITIPAGAHALYISGRFDWVGAQIMVNIGAEPMPYVEYAGVREESTSTTMFARKNNMEVSLPEQYELVVGDTFELFWQGVVKALNPDLYYIEAVCAKGAPYQHRYIYTPTASDVGEHKLTVNVYDQMHILLASGETKLVVKAKASSPSAEKVVLYVGDSLANGGQVPDELHRRLTASGGTPIGDGLSNITFIGTCSSARNKVPYEGYGGWTFASYNSENKSAAFMWITAENHGKSDDDQHSVYKDANNTEWKIETVETGRIKIIRVSGSGALPATGSLAWVSGGVNTEVITYTASEQAAGNPFWDDAAGKVDFASYAAEQGKTNIDYVYVLLGWNSMTKSDADITAEATTFIGNVHTSFPNCKVVLLGLQIPARDGLAANYGASETWTYYNAMSHVMRLNRLYGQIAKDTENVSFVQVSGQFDTDHNMPTLERTVNMRSTMKERYQSNGVHPATDGYYQIADACYRDFIHNLQS